MARRVSYGLFPSKKLKWSTVHDATNRHPYFGGANDVGGAAATRGDAAAFLR